MPIRSLLVALLALQPGCMTFIGGAIGGNVPGHEWREYEYPLNELPLGTRIRVTTPDGAREGRFAGVGEDGLRLAEHRHALVPDRVEVEVTAGNQTGLGMLLGLALDVAVFGGFVALMSGMK